MTVSRQTAAPRTSDVEIREARVEDVPAIVALLADDPLGAGREDPADLMPYDAAFARIAADPSEVLLVAAAGDTVVGTLQLSLLPSLSRRGALRAQLEGVRVAADVRGGGVGEALVAAAVARAEAAGCVLVQLTSDATRTDARRFYERLGFTASHVGFKRALPEAAADDQGMSRGLAYDGGHD